MYPRLVHMLSIVQALTLRARLEGSMDPAVIYLTLHSTFCARQVSTMFVFVNARLIRSLVAT